MRGIYIDRKGVEVGWTQGALELRVTGEAPRRVPLRGIERVVVSTGCTFSSSALNGLWERGISICFLSGRRMEAAARFTGHVHNDARIRLRQVAVLFDARTRLTWSTDLLLLRLRHMKRTALGIARRRQRGRELLAPSIDAIEMVEARLREGPPGTLETLRGIEGALVAGWYRGFVRLFPPSLAFARRQRRPPPDPVNAALSLGYTLATAEASRTATLFGLDPAIGLVHGLAHGRDSLALDLVEPARPIVDRFVHDMFHARDLTDRHFTRSEDGALLMGKAGRAAFYAGWEEGAAPVIRALLRATTREGVRRLRALPNSPAEVAMSVAAGDKD